MPFAGHKNVRKNDGSTDDSWYQYTCAFCGNHVSGACVASTSWEYYEFVRTQSTRHVRWLQCTNCGLGSVANDKHVLPSVPFGPQIEGLPEDVKSSYSEARRCMGVNGYTAAELICRKILMHVAVEKKAEEGESFASYLTYLESLGYVTPPMKSWVDLIRQHGNQSAHELASPDKERAESTVMFTAELLRLTYEMEFLAEKFTKTDDEGAA